MCWSRLDGVKGGKGRNRGEMREEAVPVKGLVVSVASKLCVRSPIGYITFKQMNGTKCVFRFQNVT